MELASHGAMGVAVGLVFALVVTSHQVVRDRDLDQP